MVLHLTIAYYYMIGFTVYDIHVIIYIIYITRLTSFMIVCQTNLPISFMYAYWYTSTFHYNNTTDVKFNDGIVQSSFPKCHLLLFVCADY